MGGGRCVRDVTIASIAPRRVSRTPVTRASRLRQRRARFRDKLRSSSLNTGARGPDGVADAGATGKRR